jgi:hypothetical protein
MISGGVPAGCRLGAAPLDSPSGMAAGTASGSARRPDGDAVPFDVLARSADFALRGLSGCGSGCRHGLEGQEADDIEDPQDPPFEEGG